MQPISLFPIVADSLCVAVLPVPGEGRQELPVCRRLVPRRSPVAAVAGRSAVSGEGRQQPRVRRRPPAAAAPVTSADPRRGKAAIHDSNSFPNPKFQVLSPTSPTGGPAYSFPPNSKKLQIAYHSLILLENRERDCWHSMQIGIVGLV